eukprot:403334565
MKQGLDLNKTQVQFQMNQTHQDGFTFRRFDQDLELQNEDERAQTQHQKRKSPNKTGSPQRRGVKYAQTNKDINLKELFKQRNVQSNLNHYPITTVQLNEKQVEIRTLAKQKIKRQKESNKLADQLLQIEIRKQRDLRQENDLDTMKAHRITQQSNITRGLSLKIREEKNSEELIQTEINKSRQIKIKQIFESTKRSNNNVYANQEDTEEIIYTIRSLSNEQQEYQGLQERLSRIKFYQKARTNQQAKINLKSQQQMRNTRNNFPSLSQTQNNAGASRYNPSLNFTSQSFYKQVSDQLKINNVRSTQSRAAYSSLNQGKSMMNSTLSDFSKNYQNFDMSKSNIYFNHNEMKIQNQESVRSKSQIIAKEVKMEDAIVKNQSQNIPQQLIIIDRSRIKIKAQSNQMLEPLIKSNKNLDGVFPVNPLLQSQKNNLPSLNQTLSELPKYNLVNQTKSNFFNKSMEMSTGSNESPLNKKILQKQLKCNIHFNQSWKLNLESKSNVTVLERPIERQIKQQYQNLLNKPVAPVFNNTINQKTRNRLGIGNQNFNSTLGFGSAFSTKQIISRKLSLINNYDTSRHAHRGGDLNVNNYI